MPNQDNDAPEDGRTHSQDDSTRTHFSQPWDVPVPHRILGRYIVLDQIDRGGFGIVYRARDESLDRDVAVKVPHSNLLATDALREKFLEEARMLAHLDHPGIVPIFDTGRTEDGACYIVSKYIPGGSLTDRFRAQRMTHREAAEFAALAAEALQHAHDRGLTHRDVKPSNILLDEGGGPVLVDFGLALRGHELTPHGAVSGTPGYMSPEQARGEGHLVGPRTDVFSLGVVLFELLTWQRLFPSHESVSAKLERVKRHRPRPLCETDPAVPRELDRACQRALSQRASDRHATAGELAEELRCWLEGRRHSVGPSATRRPAETMEMPRPAVVPRGLRPFEKADADFFLGLLPGPADSDGLPRSVRLWKQRLDDADPGLDSRVLVLYGPSGCGKSSLVRAGILPRLGDHVGVIYLEITSDSSEDRVVAAVRKRRPEHPEGLGLAESITALRRGSDSGSGRKTVLVFDQFEQWLTPGSPVDEGRLTDALRQCDGERVQALLLVRDEFWMGITRLMRGLEIPLSEGRNCAAVDLFDSRHARDVLTELGRAYGALRAGGPDRQQSRFIGRAVSELGDEQGRVVPVRLVLFTEMVKRRPWEISTWHAVGGAEGVGVAFLEEAFDSPTAPPHHRAHADAARRLLAELVPESGSNLRGPAKPADELRNAAGCEAEPERFAELISILEGDLRLITPTDRPGDPHYQLTHDYLVPSLRQWLRRKQAETIRGRAEIRLTERAALWTSRPEAKQLPSWWEWARMRWLTRRKGWSTNQRRMMAAAGRRHVARTVVFAAALALATLGLWELAAWRDAHSFRREIQSAEIGEARRVLDGMPARRGWVEPMLREALAESEAAGDQRRELLLRLALLRIDPAQVEPLYQRLLTADPEYFAVIRGELQPFSDRLAEKCWAELEDGRASPARRFRAAAALAAFDPDDGRWGRFAASLCETLIGDEISGLSHWREAFRGAGRHLIDPLILLGEQDRDAQQRRAILGLLLDYADGREGAAAVLGERLDGLPMTESVEDDRRYANLAAMLAAVGRVGPAVPRLGLSPDLTRRGLLIERFAPWGIDPGTLFDLLAGSEDDATRQALLLALSEYETHRIRDHLPVCVSIFEDDRDPGVHMAARKLLQRHGRGDDVARIESRLATGNPVGRRGWYIDTEGQTYAVITGPDGRLLAVATTEVTVSQFGEFIPDHNPDPEISPDPDCPVNSVTWYQAVRYCNSLSDREKIARPEWCYVPNGQGEYQPGMGIAADFLDRMGYRLPTVEEWQLLCRVGTTTPWFCSREDIELAGEYVWSHANSVDDSGSFRSHPVGSLKPNPFGLFDTHGNLSEWCQNLALNRQNVADPMWGPAQLAVQVGQERIICGGNYVLNLRRMPADVVFAFPVGEQAARTNVGLRPVRRVPEPPGDPVGEDGLTE